MRKPTTTRRAFLGALAGAAPLAVAEPSAPAKAAGFLARIPRSRNHPAWVAAAVAGFRAACALRDLAAAEECCCGHCQDVPHVESCVLALAEAIADVLHRSPAIEAAIAAYEDGADQEADLSAVVDHREAAVLALLDFQEAVQRLDRADDLPDDLDGRNLFPWTNTAWLVKVFVSRVNCRPTAFILHRQAEVEGSDA